MNLSDPCWANIDPLVVGWKSALSDGVLIDTTWLAEDMGFAVPVFLTRHVHEKYIAPLAASDRHEQIRLRSLLKRLRDNIRLRLDEFNETDQLEFSAAITLRLTGQINRTIDLCAVQAPDRSCRPVAWAIIVSLPEEV